MTVKGQTMVKKGSSVGVVVGGRQAHASAWGRREGSSRGKGVGSQSKCHTPAGGVKPRRGCQAPEGARCCQAAKLHHVTWSSKKGYSFILPSCHLTPPFTTMSTMLSTSHHHSSCNVHRLPTCHTHTLPAKECVQRARSELSAVSNGKASKAATPQDHVNHPTHQNIQRSRCYITAEPTPHALCNIHKRRHHQHTTLFLLRSAGWSEHDSQLHYTRRNTTIQTTSSLYKRPLYKLSLSHH
jgi:hypothetical protein